MNSLSFWFSLIFGVISVILMVISNMLFKKQQKDAFVVMDLNLIAGGSGIATVSALALFVLFLIEYEFKYGLFEALLYFIIPVALFIAAILTLISADIAIKEDSALSKMETATRCSYSDLSKFKADVTKKIYNYKKSVIIYYFLMVIYFSAMFVVNRLF